MADQDERIRAVLDLGDSSLAVKQLDAELEKLLGEFKRLVDSYEKGTINQKDFIEQQKTLRGEISQLSGTVEQLKGAEPASDGVEKLSRAMFALERGSSALLEGKGLNRAANLIESVLAFANGPAGIGIAIGLIANTIDNVGPKIKEAWDRTFSIFSDQQIAAKREELIQKFAQLSAAVGALANAPPPGLEHQQQERDVKFRSIFNQDTMTGPGGAQNVLAEVLRHHQGGTPTDITAEEKADIQRQLDYIDPIGARNRAYRQDGVFGAIAQFVTAPGPLEQLVHPYSVQEAHTKIQEIQNTVAKRTANLLIVTAQQPGPEGRTARKQLLNLAKRFPGILNDDGIKKLEDIIHDEMPHVKEAQEKEAEEQAKAAALEYKGPALPPMPELKGGFFNNRVGMTLGPIPGARVLTPDERQARPLAGQPDMPGGIPQMRRPRYRGSQPMERDIGVQEQVDSLGNVVLDTHGIVGQTQRYTMSQHAKIEALHASTRRLEQQNRSLMEQAQKTLQNHSN